MCIIAKALTRAEDERPELHPYVSLISMMTQILELLPLGMHINKKLELKVKLRLKCSILI